MTHRQRIRFLFGLLSLWAIIALGVFGFSSEPERVPLQNVTGPGASRGDAGGGARSPGLRVDLTLFEASRSERARRFTPPRNIFGTGPGLTEIIPIERQDVAGGADGASVAGAPLSSESAHGAADAPLRYLGFVALASSGRGGRVAVIAEGEELHMVHAGETLADHAVVREITPDYVAVLELRSQKEQRLPVVELAPDEPPS